MITHFDMTDGRIIAPSGDDATDSRTAGDPSTIACGQTGLRLQTVTEAMATQRTETKVHGALLQLSPHRFEKF